MKANNLNGEYCQTCAAILDDVQRNHRRVVVLDSQCAAVFHQSGDAALLDGPKHAAPEIPSHAHKHETAEVQESVHEKAGKAKPALKGRHGAR